jgi:hypothetical protein
MGMLDSRRAIRWPLIWVDTRVDWSEVIDFDKGVC